MGSNRLPVTTLRAFLFTLVLLLANAAGATTAAGVYGFEPTAPGETKSWGGGPAGTIGSGDWAKHLGHSDSVLVNASTWGLMLTGKILTLDDIATGNPTRMLGKLVSRAGEPVVRTAMRQAMKIMGHQFVMGRTIGEALKRALKSTDLPYRYSFDMLGEAAMTHFDADRYAKAYEAACTPDFYLFDADRKLVYRGQLDGSRPGNDVGVDGRDLRCALDAVLAGDQVPDEQVPSVGCNIKWIAGNEPAYFG